MEDKELLKHTIVNLSRGTAILLLLLYVLYLWFQLRTHHNLFGAENTEAEQESNDHVATPPTHEADDEEEQHMSPWAAGAVLVGTTILVAICADYLVNSIDALVDRAGLSRNFIGLILIPIVGNAAEHVTAVVVAIKNKMDLAMGVAIGSSIQIALFVTPFLVILGWIMDRPMTLQFETCMLNQSLFSSLIQTLMVPAVETVAFALAVLVVTYTVQDGKSNYLEGAMVRSKPNPP